MSVSNFAYMLYETPLSVALRSTSWVVPMSQSVHILAIAVLVGAAMVTDLRLAGVLATDQPRRQVARHHLPWFWSAFAVLVASGIIQVLAEPSRELTNPLFWTKMGLVLLGVIVTLVLRYPVMNSDESGGRGGSMAVLIKPLAWASLLIWATIIICGRWIAYWI